MKAFHPECTGPFANVRSLESTSEVIRHVLPAFLKPYLFWLPWAVDQQGWNLQAPLEKLTGPTMIVYHKDDEIIPYDASAHKAAKKQMLDIQSVELFQTDEQFNVAKLKKRKIDHHSEPLKNYYTAAGVKAEKVIADFILNSQARRIAKVA